MKRSRTRTAVRHEIFGVPAKLPDLQLPLYIDVMKSFLFERKRIMDQECTQEYPSNRHISGLVAKEVKQVWEKASLPTCSNKSVVDRIERYYNEATRLLKSTSKGTTHENKVKSMMEYAEKTLFDICACRCATLAEGTCNCTKDRKVHKREAEFLLDQRGDRKMFIGSIDEETTEQNVRRIERQSRSSKHKDDAVAGSSSEVTDTAELSLGTSSDEDEADSNDFLYHPDPDVRILESQMRTPLPNFASAAYRTGVSTRHAALLASALLTDVGLVTEVDKSSVVSKNKVDREVLKFGQQIQENDAENRLPLTALFFDGRKDQTKVNEKIGDSLYRSTRSEEHISLVQEPGGNYIGHTTPSSGHGSSIADSIITFLEQSNIMLDDLSTVGCDGTVINTGVNNGAIPNLENKLKRALQWLICLLHCNELPLRHLVSGLDGKSSGPYAYSGPIGKALTNCEKMPVVEFVPISAPWTETIESVDLSTDQAYLLDMCRAISTGQCDISLERRNPGNLNLSRWLTTANRILRLFVSTAAPSESLTTLVEFILKVYAPSWFNIKKNSPCTDGARNFHHIVLTSRNLDERSKAIVDPVLRRNAFFAHPENILLAMLRDTRKETRILAWQRIQQARLDAKKHEGEIRVFKVPKINLEAMDYVDLVTWTSAITEPPLTRKFSDNEVEEFLSSGKILDDENIVKIPCHTQAVERCVQLVAEAANAKCGFDGRDRVIRAKLHSRRLMPKLIKKSDFKGVNEHK